MAERVDFWPTKPEMTDFRSRRAERAYFWPFSSRLAVLSGGLNSGQEGLILGL